MFQAGAGKRKIIRCFNGNLLQILKTYKLNADESFGYRQPESVFIAHGLKWSCLKMGSHGKALAVSFFRRRARLRSSAHDFHYSFETFMIAKHMNNQVSKPN